MVARGIKAVGRWLRLWWITLVMAAASAAAVTAVAFQHGVLHTATAGWIQAVGTLWAIWGAFLIQEQQRRRAAYAAEAGRLGGLLAVARAAERCWSEAHAAYDDAALLERRFVEQRIAAVAQMEAVRDALSRIEPAEVGDHAVVRMLVGLHGHAIAAVTAADELSLRSLEPRTRRQLSHALVGAAEATAALEAMLAERSVALTPPARASAAASSG